MRRLLRATLHFTETTLCWVVALIFAGMLRGFSTLNRWLEDS